MRCNDVLALKPFLFEMLIVGEGDTNQMEHLKATRKAITEMNESYRDMIKTTKETTRTVHDTQQLWKTGYKSRLIKIGVALVVFPEPTPISESVGACFIAAGAVQKAIRSRALFMEDVKKTFQSTLREISDIKQSY